MDYYCRFCDDYVLASEVVQGYDTKASDDYVAHYDSCPKCGNLIFEEADLCVCGEHKLATAHLCKRCHAVAAEEWQKCNDTTDRRVNACTVPGEIMEIYLKSEVFNGE